MLPILIMPAYYQSPSGTFAKICSHCEETYLGTNDENESVALFCKAFPLHKHTCDGFSSWCSKCHYQAHRRQLSQLSWLSQPHRPGAPRVPLLFSYLLYIYIYIQKERKETGEQSKNTRTCPPFHEAMRAMRAMRRGTPHTREKNFLQIERICLTFSPKCGKLYRQNRR